MFPLEAKENGVLERDGHTEATVDIVKLAGLKECGLCCEIMEEDRTYDAKRSIRQDGRKIWFN